jgi:hypothetical protein
LGRFPGCEVAVSYDQAHSAPANRLSIVQLGAPVATLVGKIYEEHAAGCPAARLVVDAPQVPRVEVVPDHS